jgi:2Fe-2S ferredoxin
MPVVTITPSGKTIEGAEGGSLLDALLAAGEKIATQCGGEAKCGACHVFVIEGRKGISKMSKLENSRLDEIIGVGSKSRLACQVVLGTEPVTVEVLTYV